MGTQTIARDSQHGTDTLALTLHTRTHTSYTSIRIMKNQKVDEKQYSRRLEGKNDENKPKHQEEQKKIKDKTD
jgi:hypothetical protein